MKSMAEYALENKALIKLFIAFLVIGGLWSFYSMSKMEDPEITVKQALVMTVYPGATAHQVELEVSDKLEKAIRQMGDIDYIESKSLNDLSLILGLGLGKLQASDCGYWEPRIIQVLRFGKHAVWFGLFDSGQREMLLRCCCPDRKC